MGSGLKKGKANAWDMGSYLPEKEDTEAMIWCTKNNIKIAPEGTTAGNWVVVISINGRINKSPESYKKNVIWQKIFEFYKYYFKKYKK